MRRTKCRGCGKSNGEIKWYVIADDLENPKPYHPICMEELQFEVMLKLAEEDNK